MAIDDTLDQMFDLLGVADRVCRKMFREARSRTVPRLSCRRIVVTLLQEPNSTDREIGWQLGMSSAQVSRDVRSLIDASLVSISPSPHHGAQRLLNLTSSGREAAVEVLASLKRAFADAYAEETRTTQAKLAELTLSRKFLQPPGGGRRAYRVLKGDDWSWLFTFWAQQAATKADPNDARHIERISRTMAWVASKPWGRDDMAFVCEEGGRLIGAAVVTLGETPQELDLETTIAWITFLAVDRSNDREAVRREMIVLCAKLANHLSMTSLNMRVPRGQVEMIESLAASGFHKASRQGRRGDEKSWVDYGISNLNQPAYRASFGIVVER